MNLPCSLKMDAAAEIDCASSLTDSDFEVVEMDSISSLFSFLISSSSIFTSEVESSSSPGDE